MVLHLVPVAWQQAREFVDDLHRHLRAPPGHKFSVGVANERGLCGVVVVGRPVARHSDDGLTLEVTRCCTDGTRNAASMLYGAAARAAFALGYTSVITYTRQDEGGASLRASNWRRVREIGARSGWGGGRPPEAELAGPDGPEGAVAAGEPAGRGACSRNRLTAVAPWCNLGFAGSGVSRRWPRTRITCRLRRNGAFR